MDYWTSILHKFSYNYEIATFAFHNEICTDMKMAYENASCTRVKVFQVMLINVAMLITHIMATY